MSIGRAECPENIYPLNLEIKKGRTLIIGGMAARWAEATQCYETKRRGRHIRLDTVGPLEHVDTENDLDVVRGRGVAARSQAL